MSRTRYQGAIVQNHQLLLVQHRHHDNSRAYWLLPGGGHEPGESPEDCVRREMREETGLEVRVERLLLEFVKEWPGSRQTMATYLCTPLGGEARPGHEPEPEANSVYAIAAVAWLDLRRPESWPPEVLQDSITLPQLRTVLQALGYA
ncbi:MAG: NUDIX hydrolase [Chloroflexi bacterium]|nr:NUDIX hydrolase [Chloroflexota bacterium]